MNEPYKIYIDGMELPLAPSSIEVNIPNKNEKITLLNGQELNLIKREGLMTFTFKIYLPSEKIPMVRNFVAPAQVIDKLKDLKTNKENKKKIFQFMIIRAPSGLPLEDSMNKTCTLEDFTQVEDAEELGRDIAIDVVIQVYEPLKTQKMEITGDNKVAEKPTSLKAVTNIAMLKAPAPVRAGYFLADNLINSQGSNPVKSTFNALKNIISGKTNEYRK